MNEGAPKSVVDTISAHDNKAQASCSGCPSPSGGGMRQSARGALHSLITVLRSRAENMNKRADLLEYLRDSLPEDFAEKNSEAEEALWQLVVSTRQDW